MLFELIPRVAIATLVVLFSTNPFAPAAYAAEGAPDRVRSIQFEYRTDIPVTDSQAHKLEVWIPLPREDRWQRVEALSIDTPSQHENGLFFHGCSSARSAIGRQSWEELRPRRELLTSSGFSQTGSASMRINAIRQL
jgi:hypothetical protein